MIYDKCHLYNLQITMINLFFNFGKIRKYINEILIKKDKSVKA